MTRKGEDILNPALNDSFEFHQIHSEEMEDAAHLEQVCFPPHEACAREDMLSRFAVAPELSLVARNREQGEVAGLLTGIATEESRFRDAFFTDSSLHRPDGRTVMLLGLEVLPAYQGQGLARALMEIYSGQEQEKGRMDLVLTCLSSLVPMYQKFGFQDEGRSGSNWGAEQWHEMRKKLN